jgi:hypothetical protein
MATISSLNEVKWTPEYLKGYNKQYYQTHKDQRKQYYLAHREAILAYKRAWYQRNREYLCFRQRINYQLKRK